MSEAVIEGRGRPTAAVGGSWLLLVSAPPYLMRLDAQVAVRLRLTTLGRPRPARPPRHPARGRQGTNTRPSANRLRKQSWVVVR